MKFQVTMHPNGLTDNQQADCVSIEQRAVVAGESESVNNGVCAGSLEQSAMNLDIDKLNALAFSRNLDPKSEDGEY
jgi:hypothetical protein